MPKLLEQNKAKKKRKASRVELPDLSFRLTTYLYGKMKPRRWKTFHVFLHLAHTFCEVWSLGCLFIYNSGFGVLVRRSYNLQVCCRLLTRELHCQKLHKNYWRNINWTPIHFMCRWMFDTSNQERVMKMEVRHTDKVVPNCFLFFLKVFEDTLSMYVKRQAKIFISYDVSFAFINM